MHLQFDSITTKLNEFIRKYYLNRLLQGGLLSLGGLVAVFISAALIEYFGHFGTATRAVLFYGYIGFALYILGVYVAMPLSKLMGLSKTMPHEQAATLIGEHFPEIKDKLLNTLQLKQQVQGTDNELLLASIDQRIQTLNPFSFSTAVDLPASVRKYGRYAIVPLSLLGIILLFQSHIITGSTERIVQYNNQFAKEAPFVFELQNKDLNALRNTDLELKMITKGSQLPAEVFINVDNHLIKMESQGRNTFTYLMQNLTAGHKIFFTDGEFTSNTYAINVLPNPILLNFKINLKYPAYTGKKNETIENTGDITIPQGTQAEWVFNTKDAERLDFIFNNTRLSPVKDNDRFVVSQTIKQSSRYYLQLANAYMSSKDTIKFNVQTIDDRYPGIAAEQQQDSINPFIYYFYGKADDDYGLSKLQFVYRPEGSQAASRTLPVQIGKGTDEIFYYMVDLKSLISKDGETLEYYFEVWDNDAVNGRKSSKTQVFKAIAPSKEELKAESENSSNSIKQKMKEAMQESISLQKKTKELSKELMESNELSWQQQQKIKDFLNEQKKLENKLEQLKKENREKNERDEQLNPKENALKEKQKEIEKLFDELLTPEMKEMLKKLEEQLKQENKEGVQQQLDKMKLDNEARQKQIDRTLEQFKQMELEKKMEEQISELNELAKEQEALSEKTKDKSQNQEQLKEQQNAIDKKFKDIKQSLDDIEKKNNELESPMQLDDTKNDQQQIDNELKQSNESLDKKQNKKASESQKKAADKMEEMAAKMEKSMQQAKEKQNEEDYYTLRQILENLVELSQQQEQLMAQMKEQRAYNPKYVDLSARQRKLKEDAKMVEDSLQALSRRQVQIRSFVNKEITRINDNMDKAIGSFGKIEIHQGLVQQQYVMTGLNNLAVMLSESLKKMQEQMNEQKDQQQGKGQCKNPGGKNPKPGGKNGKPKMSGMKEMQQGIGQQMQQMKQGQQQGQKPTSEQFARIAAQQEALRKEIERLQKLLKEEGKEGALGDLNKTKELMEQQERDLVNKQITPETIERMKEIETRMLEHEKAEREQDQDNRREAEQARNTSTVIPPAIKAYLEQKAREMELLRSLPAELSPYYKDRVRAYFKKVGNQ